MRPSSSGATAPPLVRLVYCPGPTPLAVLGSSPLTFNPLLAGVWRKQRTEERGGGKLVQSRRARSAGGPRLWSSCHHLAETHPLEVGDFRRLLALAARLWGEKGRSEERNSPCLPPPGHRRRAPPLTPIAPGYSCPLLSGLWASGSFNPRSGPTKQDAPQENRLQPRT